MPNLRMLNELTSIPAITQNAMHDGLIKGAEPYLIPTVDAEGQYMGRAMKPLRLRNSMPQRVQNFRKIVQGQTFAYYQDHAAEIHRMAGANLAKWAHHAKGAAAAPAGIRILTASSNPDAEDQPDAGDYAQAALDVAKRTGEKPFILTMADAGGVGGAYLHGGGSQEANLSLRSNSWVDYPAAPTYDDATRQQIEQGLFYRDNRVLFRQSATHHHAQMASEDWLPFAECRMAAIKVRTIASVSAEQADEFRAKIAAMLNLAMEKGHNHLILNPIDAGFGREPKLLATLFKEEIEKFQREKNFVFESITFPIPAQHRQTFGSAFHDVFEPKAPTEESGSGLRIGDADDSAVAAARAASGERKAIFNSEEALRDIKQIIDNINDADSQAASALSKAGHAYELRFDGQVGQIEDKKAQITSTLTFTQEGLELDNTSPGSADVALTIFLCQYLGVKDLPKKDVMAQQLKGADITFYGEGADLFKDAFERVSGMHASELKSNAPKPADKKDPDAPALPSDAAPTA